MRKTKMFGRILAGGAALAMACSLVVTAVPAEAAKKKKEKAAKEVDLNGTYNATLGIQTDTLLWITRMGYYEKSQNEFYGTEYADKMFCEDADNPGEKKILPGTFVDAEIKGNGTYTVTLKDAEFQGETALSQLHVATDIPLNDTIKFSDVIVKVNGKTLVEFEEGFMEDQENYLQGGMVCLAFNHWRPLLVEELSNKGMIEDAPSGGYTVLNGTGTEEVSITFTVSGFEYDNPDATGEEEAEEEATGDDANASASVEEKKDEEGNGGAKEYIIGVAVGLLIVFCIVFLVRKRKK